MKHSIPEILKAAIQQHKSGHTQKAEHLYNLILQQQPDNTEVLHLLAALLFQKGARENALNLLERLVELEPSNPFHNCSLGKVLLSIGRLDDAARLFNKAIKIKPDFAEGFFYKGLVLKVHGNVEAAYKSLKEAVRLQPDLSEAHRNVLFLLSYHTLETPSATLKAHQEWGRLYGGAEKLATFRHADHDNPDRRLRIGYVSPDFRRHAASCFFEPILTAHDRSKVEIYCYAEVANPDEVSKRIESLADSWRSTIGISDESMAHMIKNDRIDILVDLAGHTGNNRLKAFAYKPAPIQATYIGYCNTTGLAAMDYLISDEILHPQDTVELTTETIYRLPRCWVCYQPPEDTPIIAGSNKKTADITFGSLNNISKYTPEVILLWSQILHQLPDSRLLIKTGRLNDKNASQRLLSMFSEHGVDPQRLQLLPFSFSYMDTYNDIDIALDTFPRTGGATTADALWMGVPVVTMEGQRFIERQGVSMMAALGLQDLVAKNPEEYAAKAVQLATDHDYRNRLHNTIHARMEVSPLRDSRGLAQALETAYRNMWRHYLNH